VKDAQRHGLKFKPIDIMKSKFECTVERGSCNVDHEAKNSLLQSTNLVVRLGLNYVRGLRAEAAKAIVEERSRGPFHSIADVARRVPALRKNELVMLADVGALNSIGSSGDSGLKLHRRDALWQVERAARYPGPLLEGIHEFDERSPLTQMTNEERLVADFRGTGLTVGPHPMAYQRKEMTRRGIQPAIELPRMKNGIRVKTAGCVIARQRPGTAHGFVFLSLEDETGIANAIITPDLFEKNRVLLVSERFLMVEGILQNIDNVVSVKADSVFPLEITNAATTSHDFH
jgi:error-prone DNA polymerase